MTDLEFVSRLKQISDKSDLDKNTKKEYGLIICAVCSDDECQKLIEEFMAKNDVTIKSLFDYTLSIVPPIEFVDDDE